MSVYRIDPLADLRWPELVERAPQASIFHSPGWLEAVRRTYGYGVVAYTTSPPAEPLVNAVVVSSIRSWLTGSRLVSGAFADHCDPLFTTHDDDVHELIDALSDEVRRGAWKYLELRPTNDAASSSGLIAYRQYFRHVLDLRPPIDDLLAGCHTNSVRRKIRRAQRESLSIEAGRSDAALTAFYALLCSTRRRHQLPPPPIEWFRNLVDCLGDSVSIQLALKDGRPIGATFLIRHRDVVVYKYGGSDASTHATGAMPFLLWNAIVEGKRAGMRQFDFGRSDMDQSGLIMFKDRFGATRSTITYFRFSRHRQSRPFVFATRMGRAIARNLPDGALAAAGRVLYRHVG
jgi:hypothetical protein